MPYLHLLLVSPQVYDKLISNPEFKRFECASRLGEVVWELEAILIVFLPQVPEELIETFSVGFERKGESGLTRTFL